MKKKIFSHLRRWHRRLGISAAIFILFLSASGIVINHSDDLNLPQSFIDSEMIWSLYGIKDPRTVRVFQTGNKKIILVDEQLWLGNKLLLRDVGNLKSAVVFNGIIVAVLNQELLLMSMDGEIIERMDSSTGIPDNINYLATTADKIWVKTDKGFYVSDEQLLKWQLAESDIKLSKNNSVELLESENREIIANYKSKLISWERLFLDIHSGRILGKIGPLFSDLVALLLILLSLSGIYMWVRSTKARRTKK